MHLEQRVRHQGAWATHRGAPIGERAQLALVFGSTTTLRDAATWSELRARYPRARLVGCSTAGEISGARVLDNSVVATALALEHGRIAVTSAELGEAPDSTGLGELLASRLPADGLVHVLVLSDGLRVNGSALVAGLASRLGPGVAVTGGLSADGARFERTAVCLDGPTPTEQVVVIGLYGARLRVGYGSLGGWDPFGPERRITRAEGNVLFELDGEPALDLYKRYLGAHAAALPVSGLLYPLAIRANREDPTPVGRTILSVDENRRSLTFAGDMPVGYCARMMHANFERLVDGACGAARTSVEAIGDAPPDLAILISCVGRKLVLKQRVEEEVEAVRHVLGGDAVMTGFYAYGAISPSTQAARCELHNQTMAITTLAER